MAKTFKFVAQTSPLHHLLPCQLFLTKFLLNALKIVICSPP